MKVIETTENKRSWKLTWRERVSKSRLYVSVDDENMAENFAFRWDRPWTEYRKLMPEILQRLGLPEDTKYNWSQKAGCSCGCSPGFVLTLPNDHRKCVDYWATVAGDDAKVAEMVNVERIQNRAEVLATL